MKISDLKEMTKAKLTGSYLKCTISCIFYFIIALILTYLQKLANIKVENSFLLALVQALFLVVAWILGYGIIANILQLTEGKTKSITNFINITILHAIRFIKIGLRLLLKLIVPISILILSGFYLLGTMYAAVNEFNFYCFHASFLTGAKLIFELAIIIFIYFALNYALISYIYYENNDLSPKEIAEKSKELMKGNKFKFILIYLSYFGWFVIAAIILRILNMFIEAKYLLPIVILFYSILKPHITITKSAFYMTLSGQTEVTAEKKR